ncbi:uncharacterized protein LOC131163360 [Malania oleifera]|uniref:uncharacterized protein LOC131163360 n=1 Tax=Malania oleifera TaxID=397392 RepID=UPI0025ADBBDC|nr:uncharacterized protein LOC131163360 [Malania oleifera]
MIPPTVLGGIDPAATENWIQEIEKDLAVLQCTKAHRVLFATYKLTGEANGWWIAMKLLEQQRMALIEQLMIQQYTTRFIELSRFTSFIILDAAKKVRHYERDLRCEIYQQVIVLKIQDFAELVNRAVLAEVSEWLGAKEQGQNKRSTPSSFQQGFGYGQWRRGNYDRGQRQKTGGREVRGAQTYLVCQICGRRHLGECRAGRGVCYCCGGSGHLARDCPTPIGTAPDPRGETHLLDVEMSVASPDDSMVKCRRVLSGYLEEIQGRVLPADLIVLDMYGFDVILGEVDPAVAENWMQEIEKVLAMLQCTEEQRVLFATHRMTGEAERYFPSIVNKAKVEEFLSLKQG